MMLNDRLKITKKILSVPPIGARVAYISLTKRAELITRDLDAASCRTVADREPRMCGSSRNADLRRSMFFAMA